MNIYLLSEHLSPADTQNLLAIALALGIVGFLLANPSLVTRVFSLFKGASRSQESAPPFAAEPK